jgi:hypothetical protein
MAKPTFDEVTEIIAEHLTEVADGGYPGHYLWVGSTLVYVTQNTGEKHDSQLGTITAREMRAWYKRAVAFLKENPDFGDDISSALYETENQRS